MAIEKQSLEGHIDLAFNYFLNKHSRKAPLAALSIHVLGGNYAPNGIMFIDNGCIVTQT